MKIIILSLLLSLSAIAREPIVTVEYEVQKKLGTDIVLVIDNSGSMTEHQDTLARLSNVFIDELTLVDYRIVGLSTDQDEVPFGIIEATDSDQDRRLAEMIALFGTNGSAIETPFESFFRFFNSENGNTFFRQGFSKEIVVLTDEDDQTEMSVQDIISFMGANKFVVNAISENANEPGCTGLGSNERLVAVVEATAGQQVNICGEYSYLENEYRKLAKAIASRSQNSGYNSIPVKSYQLEEGGDLDSIEVFYGSQIIKRGLKNSGWIVNETSNTIEFGSKVKLAPQPEGTKFIIRYSIN